MNDSLSALAWPIARLGEAIDFLARRAGLAPRPVDPPAPPAGVAREGPEALSRWIETAAGILGIEAEPIEVLYADLEELLATGGPALLSIPGPEGPRFLALLGRRGREVALLAPDGRISRAAPATIREASCERLEAPLAPGTLALVSAAGVPEVARSRAAKSILAERLGGVRVAGLWLLSLSPGAPLARQMAESRLAGKLAVFLGAYLAQYVLFLLSWYMIGRGALEGRLDRGWLLAWGLVLLTIVPFRALSTWAQGVLAIGVGGLVKRRLLFGALRYDPDAVRREGAGGLLGRVLESEALESLALSGGFLALVSVLELLFAGAVLWVGAGGTLLVALAAVWLAASLFLGARYHRERARWTDSRLGMTNDLVERMVGHRTRAAQEARERWHEGEDQALERYLDGSRRMDAVGARLVALVPRGWLVLALAGFALPFVRGSAPPGALAIALGGILLALRAFQKLASGLAQLAGAAVAWRAAAPLYRAAARPWPAGVLLPESVASRANPDEPAALARDVVFRYPARPEPVLAGATLAVGPRDRVLLEGPSGGGKSTFASLLVGLRAPDSGLLLLGGLDRQTLGADGWRRRVTAAPQFHENHVLTGTLAFNLLLGRRWPAHPEDLQEAAAVCAELGLAPLLARMPAGLLQMVGETGWQLSHGERSRLYVARALLQGADLVVLDESFAALDPENLRRALTTTLSRAKALLVIAHP